VVQKRRVKKGILEENCNIRGSGLRLEATADSGAKALVKEDKTPDPKNQKRKDRKRGKHSRTSRLLRGPYSRKAEEVKSGS